MQWTNFSQMLFHISGCVTVHGHNIVMQHTILWTLNIIYVNMYVYKPLNVCMNIRTCTGTEECYYKQQGQHSAGMDFNIQIDW